MTDLPDYVTVVAAKANLSPLEKLAWTKLTEEEFVDKLAPEIWKAPLLRRRADGRPVAGRAGVSFAKVDGYISTYGSHFRGDKRKHIKELLFDRSSKLLHERCCDWALEAFRNCGGDIFGLQASVSSIVPEGCRRMVLDTFSAALAECSWAINKTLDAAKFKPVAHLSSKKARDFPATRIR